MTTQAPAQPTSRPIPSPFKGAGKLWISTFLSHILNPWNMAFALLLPMFMYAMLHARPRPGAGTWQQR